MSTAPDQLPLPYYAVVFTSQHTGVDEEAYRQTAVRMEELAAQQPGFLGIESVRNADGTGITVSYWRSRESIAAWKRHAEHLAAQAAGRTRWYAWYRLRIACVEADYGAEPRAL